MEFSIEITQAALTDAEEYVRFIREDRGEPIAADLWWNSLIDQILSLERLPRRCSIIPEQKYFEQEIRISSTLLIESFSPSMKVR